MAAASAKPTADNDRSGLGLPVRVLVISDTPVEQKSGCLFEIQARVANAASTYGSAPLNDR
jgi:hypothetical protein